MKNEHIVRYMVLLCTAFTLSLSFPADDCANKPADVVFILDSSNSIWLRDFYKQTSFVRDVVSKFDTGPGPTQTRVGVLTFGHDVWKKFDLNDIFDKDELLKSIESIQHGRGRTTNTGDAINYALDKMFTPAAGAREGVTRVVIVITDGRSQRTYETKHAARRLHEAKINTFSVGVGRNLDLIELQDIASDPDSDFLFMVDDFNALTTITNKLARKACEVSTPVPPTTTTTTESVPSDQSLVNCGGKPADVFFLVDASGSITDKDFSREISFVQNVVDMFDIAEDKTRVGLISFSHDAQLILPLNNKLSKTKLIEEIAHVPHIAGGTDTSEALRLVRQRGFAPNVARPNIAKIAIVLTDGLSMDADLTAQEARYAHAAGIKVFSIGIGYYADLLEIRNIASDPDDNFVFQVDDFRSLDTIKEILAIKTCDVKPEELKDNQKTEPACIVTGDTDMMFVYDTKALGVSASKIITEFLAKIVTRLDLSSGHLRVGRITDNCPSGGSFQLSNSVSALDFSEIRTPSYADLLKKVRRTAFSSEYGGRTNASNVAVMFIDSQMEGLDDMLLNEAKSLKNTADVMVVSIGGGDMVTKFSDNFSQSLYMHVNSYTDLDKAAEDFLLKMCDYFAFKSLDYNIDYVIPV